MFYNILRNQDDKIISFMIDENDMPVEYKTEKEAEEAKKGHVAEFYIETIEI